MPGGKKQFVSIKSSDKTQIHVQKKLVLGNLKELFELSRQHIPMKR
jgi:hypothetical protein